MVAPRDAMGGDGAVTIRKAQRRASSERALHLVRMIRT